MSIPAKSVTFVLLSLFVSGSFAAGGKVQADNPIFGDDCVEVTAPGVDLDNCTQVPAPPQAGITVFFCDSTRVIVCGDEEDGD